MNKSILLGFILIAQFMLLESCSIFSTKNEVSLDAKGVITEAEYRQLRSKMSTQAVLDILDQPRDKSFFRNIWTYWLAKDGGAITEVRMKFKKKKLLGMKQRKTKYVVKDWQASVETDELSQYPETGELEDLSDSDLEEELSNAELNVQPSDLSYTDSEEINPEELDNLIDQEVSEDVIEEDINMMTELNQTIQMDTVSEPGYKHSIRSRLKSWSQAWSSQDVNAYISHYRHGYKTKSFSSHKNWKNSRGYIIKRAQFISVEISKVLSISNNYNGQVAVTFVQNYVSDTFKDTTTKKIIWQLDSNNVWRIIEEIVL